MGKVEIYILSVAFVLDLLLGDPKKLPHLIVGFGNAISFGEKKLNRSNLLLLKGAFLTIVLVCATFILSYLGLQQLKQYSFVLYFITSTLLLFYCLANRTLIEEGKAVFSALKKDLVSGRERLSWIVGRDTTQLNEQQVKKATFETMSENLSDGVIAPLFYFMILGVPGAMAYKMINTLDSMIGYKSDRYLLFGRFAARLDDVANFVPARLTAFLMLAVTLKFDGLTFLFKEGKKHSSPNAGYPEAALAYILSCRFGGPNTYHGQLVEKPYIGSNDRMINDNEIHNVATINIAVSILMVMIIIACQLF